MRRRVLSYFREDPAAISSRIRSMLSKAAGLETLSTTTEKEALLLEASLIKKHRPRYNIVLRDDKQYVLFRLARTHDFPRLEIVRSARRDKARYFGPYTSGDAARKTWKLIHQAFHLRRCTDRALKNRVRPCLYHYIGQCHAPCMGLVSKEDYALLVRRVEQLLAGRAGSLMESLRKEMETSADALEFERAAILRDQMRAVERTLEKQAAFTPGGGDMDVIGLHAADSGLALGVVFVREGRMLDGRSFFWAGLGFEDAGELVGGFLSQFYGALIPAPRIVLPWLPEDESAGDNQEGGAMETAEGVVPAAETGMGAYGTSGADAPSDLRAAFALADLEEMLASLRGGAVRIHTPRDAKESGLVDIAASNAREAARLQAVEEPLMTRLGRVLHLAEPPARIECVDVSHTSGGQARVGMVVFEDGRPMRNLWRAYALEESGGDDFGTLAEFTRRRLQSGSPWPDLLLIDGGRGQLSAVERALEEAGQSGLFALAALAKARDEQGRPDRRAGNVGDRVFLPGRQNQLPLREGSAELLFLQLMRDSAHRFALGRHRKARTGAALTGELTRLPGVGPSTARLLWDAFGSVESMASANLEDLLAVPGIGAKRAELLLKKLQDLVR